jgi:crotonobetainyl-CoA:carnitine CoA-transferase CaiB-like acyl-CoA transferase
MEGGMVNFKPQPQVADFDCLAGVRVVDLSQYEAGPSCTETLAWLGAEVVKIEKPGAGEPARYGYARRPDKDSWYFCQFNANKKSVTLDLKSPRGIELLKEMVAQADVFIENLAPGTIERLGLGYEAVKSLNPKLIYCQIKGFGEGSPYESFLSYDPVAQAMGGIYSVTGEKGRQPVKPGPGLGDTGTGMVFAISILGALYRAQRTGQGQRLQVAMQDACMSYIRLAWAHTLHTGEACGRHGGSGVTGNVVPMDVFPCKPGGPNDYIVMYCHAGVPEQFQRLLKVMGRDELVGDPRYISQDARAQHRDEVYAMITEWTMKNDKYEVMRLLGEAKIPVGAVRDTRELMDDPDFEQRGLMQYIDHQQLGEFKMVGWPVRHDGHFSRLKPAPLVGSNTEEIFTAWLKMEPDEVEKLRKDGVV